MKCGSGLVGLLVAGVLVRVSDTKRKEALHFAFRISGMCVCFIDLGLVSMLIDRDNSDSAKDPRCCVFLRLSNKDKDT